MPTDDASKSSPVSPREHLRGRRPTQFSDTRPTSTSSLNRSLLEYHLSTVTSRNQESQFASFALKLAQRTICPNLIPQTGPTGGGDSKVDSETFPVADELVSAWFVGTPNASSERWGFAFSSKKAWRSKVDQDVKKLVATGRGYTKAFYVSNQLIRDKERGEVEDRLRTEHGIDVRILDATWILDRVFEGHHEQLAIEALQMDVPKLQAVEQGPLDAQRETLLKEVEERILAATQEGARGFALVADCITATELARSLERPRPTLDGLFDRATRNASAFGTPHQQLVNTYNRAWTAFWWHEDFRSVAALYPEVERMASGSRNAYELELLSNLWNLLYIAHRNAHLPDDEALLDARRSILERELERLSSEEDRPSTALHARALLLQLRLLTSDPSEREAIFAALHDVIAASEHLLGFPFEPLAQLLTEVGNVIDTSPAFESLYDSLIAVASKREGGIAAGRLVVKRGQQHLAADRPYEAIRSLGRGLLALHQHESREDVAKAMYLLANAYERVDLLWAARGTLLRAASIATNDFWTYETVTPLQVACYGRMKWLELQLGRLPHLLAWHELECTTMALLNSQGYDVEDFEDPRHAFDACLGILFLRMDVWHLSRLNKLPGVLDRALLCLAAGALWYALGHADQLPVELVEKPDSPEHLLKFFRLWRDQPASQDLPDTVSLYDSRMETLRTVILGCEVSIDTPTERWCLELAESVLGALESFMATTMVDGGMAHEPRLTMRLRRSDYAEEPLTFTLADRDGHPHFDLVCSSLDFKGISRDHQGAIHDTLVSLVAHACARAFFIRESMEGLERMVRDDLALTRAVTFATSHLSLSNVLGHEAKVSLDAWLSDPAVPSYALMRVEEWDASDRRDSVGTAGNEPLEMGKGPAPKEVTDMSRVKHSAIKVMSIIRVPLWDEAKWAGLTFLTSDDPEFAPVLAPMFGGEEAARKIFEGWSKDIGTIDKENRLRLSILTGVSREHPHAYRLLVGPNYELADFPEGTRHVTGVNRFHTMQPSSDKNLNNFLASYREKGCYAFACAVVGGPNERPRILRENALLKGHLFVREAWTVGLNDPERFAILPSDDPVVPEGVETVPVIELLKKKREG